MRLRVGAGTDTGRVRNLNEDVYVLRKDRGLFLVCDGMGGAPAGEVASQLAADAILQRLEMSDDSDDPSNGESMYLPWTNRLADAVRQSNREIYRHGQTDRRRAEMGTTVVGAWLNHHVASVAHVGDSRAYLWRDNGLQLLTSDHSLVEAQVSAGVLAREGILQSRDQHILLRVLGGAPDVVVDLQEVPVRPGDYLLLCSDGLTRMVPDSTVADAIVRWRAPQRICDYLIDLANRNGGADNITVVVVEVVESWWRRLLPSLQPRTPRARARSLRESSVPSAAAMRSQRP
ncbi:MAG TPA: PP2C family serine/threonine-protein phosphatase [Vicinamibacterales bacterium]|jgi:protein phosphatase